MNKAFFNFIFGFTAGAVISVIFAKDYYGRQAEESIRDMEREVSAYAKKIAKKNEEAKNAAMESIILEREFVPTKVKSEGEYIKYYNQATSSLKEKLDDFAKEAESVIKDVEYSVEDDVEEETDDSEEDEEDYIPPYPDHPKDGPRGDPYSITPESFASEYPYYDKVTLIYFEGDNVLIYEEGTEEVSIDDVGINFKSHIGEYEDEVAYIRNELLGSDYEIILNTGSFADYTGW